MLQFSILSKKIKSARTSNSRKQSVVNFNYKGKRTTKYHQISVQNVSHSFYLLHRDALHCLQITLSYQNKLVQYWATISTFQGYYTRQWRLYIPSEGWAFCCIPVFHRSHSITITLFKIFPSSKKKEKGFFSFSRSTSAPSIDSTTAFYKT